MSIIPARHIFSYPQFMPPNHRQGMSKAPTALHRSRYTGR